MKDPCCLTAPSLPGTHAAFHRGSSYGARCEHVQDWQGRPTAHSRPSTVSPRLLPVLGACTVLPQPRPLSPSTKAGLDGGQRCREFSLGPLTELRRHHPSACATTQPAQAWGARTTLPSPTPHPTLTGWCRVQSKLVQRTGTGPLVGQARGVARPCGRTPELRPQLLPGGQCHRPHEQHRARERACACESRLCPRAQASLSG